MRFIFSIEFSYKDKRYSGIVRAKQKAGYTEFHVRVMNAKMDRRLFGHHVFLHSGEQIMDEEKGCTETVHDLRTAVQEALHACLERGHEVRLLAP